jgi:dTDP-4-amino-4,6-dideoxygalactose transaminase
MANLAISGGPRAAGPGTIGPRWPIFGQEERDQLAEVLESDVWGATGLGPKIDELNSSWAGYCGTKRSVALANGTVTLELALRALGIRPGDEVIVPAWTFMATVAVVPLCGAVPVFVDVDRNTLCMDPEAVEAAISERTRALIPVHFAGHPCDMDRLGEVSRKHDLVVVEDAAQAHGAVWRGKKMGRFGACGSYSFQQSKNLQCGEGGSIVTDDDALADRLHYSLSKFGRGIGERYEPFTHYELAGNATMTEFQAALLLAQLTRLEDQTDRRHRSATLLRNLLDNVEGAEPLPMDSRVDRHGCHLFLFRYDASSFCGLARSTFIAALNAEGVPCSALYPRPLFEEPMYDLERLVVRGTGTAIRVTECPETSRAAQDIVAIPQSVLLADEAELRLIPQAIEKIRADALELVPLVLAQTHGRSSAAEVDSPSCG